MSMEPLDRAAAILAGTVLLASSAGSGAATAQDVSDVAASGEPLVLASRGSLVIGGESVAQTPQQLSSIIDTPPASGGHVTAASPRPTGCSAVRPRKTRGIGTRSMRRPTSSWVRAPKTKTAVASEPTGPAGVRCRAVRRSPWAGQWS